MGWRVRYNHLGAVAKKMPKEIDDGVVETADKMVQELKATLWLDTGTIRRVTRDELATKMHAEVWVGYYLGSGFYSGFQEFGTVKQAARPIVTPTAHAYEPKFIRIETDHVKVACAAK